MIWECDAVSPIEWRHNHLMRLFSIMPRRITRSKCYRSYLVYVGTTILLLATHQTTRNIPDEYVRTKTYDYQTSELCSVQHLAGCGPAVVPTTQPPVLLSRAALSLPNSELPTAAGCQFVTYTSISYLASTKEIDMPASGLWLSSNAVGKTVQPLEGPSPSLHTPSALLWSFASAKYRFPMAAGPNYSTTSVINIKRIQAMSA